ncbi:Alkaline phosphatase synthesis sensor protein PhoR [Methylobacterium crusticola]|uniref:histidine kinase n=1 Tax=Methylobacterium crusticola TaxID=1697972 RepID=A0ABQ4QRT5_9HYPH|nr:ATP-binding protein [Methylobacterium crusticola]GJD47600.1 Alkaline phosphatase synthesis sensor protein PhoR [Methylobacterium crusticola]
MPPRPPGTASGAPVPARRAAWRGALATGAILLAGLSLARGPDAWTGALALAAVLAGGLLGAPRRGAPAVRAEPEARARHSLAEALLANIPDPVILIDRRALVIESNAAARALLPSLRNRHPLSFALRDPDVLDGIERVLRTGEPLKTLYAPRVPTERTFEVQIGAMQGEETGRAGQPNVVLFLRDLTSAKRLEAMRVDFVANASHELRTPLASLLGFVETLQGPARNDPAARERFLAIMRVQALRMTRLIDDLLSLSRIELRAHVPPTQAVEVVPLARQIVESLGALARERGVALALEAEPGPQVLGDRDEILRVIENLVENAVKYGGEGGRVEVRVARLPGQEGGPPQVEIAVRDEGPGIAPEHLPRLTERFYRVDAASSRQQGGTGLGLAIVKHILNRHRGRLLVESEPGRGATFRALIPAHAGQAGPPAPPPGG